MSNLSNTKQITRKSPSDALRELHKHCSLSYVIYEDSIIYKGYDISTLSDNKIAEVILVNNLPVQVRVLKEKPFRKRGIVFDADAIDTNFKYGGF